MLYYFINDEAEPSFFVDITTYQGRKMESLFAHRSQFTAGEVERRLNRAGGLPYLVESRDRLFGAKAGVQFAEGFVMKQPRVVDDLIQG